MLDDPDGTLGIGQVASLEMDSKFTVKSCNRMSAGFSRSSLWVRLSLNRPRTAGPLVLEVAAPWMEAVTLYLPRRDGGWLEQSTGLKLKPSLRTKPGFVLPVPAQTPRDKPAYLRLKSELSLNAGLRLWTRSAFEAHTVKKAYVFGLLYGIMGAMLLVNLVIFLATRDRAYLYYILYLAGMIGHQMCLQGQILLLTHRYWTLVPQLSLGLAAAVFFFGAAFCRAFLHAKLYAPLSNRLLQGVQGAAAVLLLFSLAGFIWWGTWLAHILALVGPVIGIAAGIKALRMGFRPARIYLPAWMILLLGSMAWGAWSMGVQFFSLLPQTTLTFAAALESMLLSLALADRIRLLQLEQKQLARRERRYRHLSLTDEVTGLFNVRYFWSKLASEVRHAQDLEQDLCMIMLDIDDFKRINDSFGHTAGDAVLAELGQLLQDQVRPPDSPCRYGGEEFALILPGTETAGGYQVAERFRRTVAGHVFEIGDGRSEQVTVSLGVASLQPGDDARQLVNRADQALYAAKDAGKNITMAETR
ncbi:MAG: sensor domain-containing diguanylate cyclase [Desulfohalobiaceae bacterium]|nr:sensor domain-containing diguanylate cyclase [Desulfohalobiaceae bacterium]